MLQFARLAWRNILRNKRRTLITLAAITAGITAIMLFFGVSNGFHNQWVTNSVRVYSGHVAIYAHNYRAERNLNRAIADADSILAQVDALPGVVARAPRLHLNGLASTPRSSAVTYIRGADPAAENAITGLSSRIAAGHYLDPEAQGQVVMGYKLAERLQAKLGEKIVLMVQAADGSIGAELFRLQGTFRLGAVDLDRNLAVVHMRDAQQLAAMGSDVTEAVVILDDPARVQTASASLQASLGANYDVLTWEDILPQAREMIDLSSVFTYVLLAIILSVVALGIANTMLMSIMERTREFGIMRSLGTQPRQIMGLIMLESVLLGSVGTATGITCGALLNFALARTGIDLSNWSGAMELVSSMRPVIYPVLSPGNVLIAAAAAFLATLLAAVYPAWRAGRLRPAEALRST